MLAIRLQRVGRKHEPVFRLVLTDSKNGPKSGKFLEILGSYDSRRGEKAVFKEEKIKEWVSKGAKLSDTVHNILIDKKVIAGKKINVLPKKSPIVDEEALKAAAEAEAKRVAEEEAKKLADSASSSVEPKEEAETEDIKVEEEAKTEETPTAETEATAS